VPYAITRTERRRYGIIYSITVLIILTARLANVTLLMLEEMGQCFIYESSHYEARLVFPKYDFQARQFLCKETDFKVLCVCQQ